MKVVYWILLVITVIGAVNWGLVGFFNFELVSYLFPTNPTVITVVFDVIGVAGLLLLVKSIWCCCGGCKCKDGKCDCGA